MERVGVLTLERIPKELQRGMRMVSARRQITLRSWLIASLYELVDAELSDYPEWRYQTKRPVKDVGASGQSDTP